MSQRLARIEPKDTNGLTPEMLARLHQTPIASSSSTPDRVLLERNGKSLRRINLETELIQRVAYDAEQGALHVTLRSNEIVERHVPEVIFWAWLASPQPDDYFNREIRSGYHRHS
jgi:hypothetical protein